MASQQRVWNRNNLRELQARYSSLAHFFANNLAFPIALADVAQSYDLEHVARALVTTSEHTHTTLPLIRLAIIREVEEYHSEPGSILRSNTFASKVSTVYARRISKHFLQTLLGDIVREMMNSKVSVEVDPGKLESLGLSEEYLDIALEKHQESLMRIATKCFNRISSTEGIDLLPGNIRDICDFIVEASSPYVDEESLLSLLGGFVILRLFCPFLISPDAFGFVPASDITPTLRRNLILVTKLLQNLANIVEFGEKEHYMIPMNKFIVENRVMMRAYLSRLPRKGVHVEDLTSHKRSIIMDEDLLAGGQSRRVSVTIGVSKFKEDELKDLLNLHKFLGIYGAKMIDHLKDLQNTLSTLSSMSGFLQKSAFSEFSRILEELGPPPVSTSAQSSGHKMKKQNASNVGSNENLAADSHYLSLLEKSREEFLKELESSVDDTILRQNDFFFRGKSPSKEGYSTFYLICSRMQKLVEERNPNISSLVFCVLRTMGTDISCPYVLVIDFSGSSIPQESTSFFKKVEHFFRAFTSFHLSNCRDVFLVHPAALRQASIIMVRTFVSFLFSKCQKCRILDVHNWKQLESNFKLDSIELPNESKNFVTKAYSIVKVNSKGKRQNRHIKFTSYSLLNIEHNTIKNEKPLMEIASIQISDTPPTIEITFEHPDSVSAASACAAATNNSLVSCTSSVGPSTTGAAADAAAPPARSLRGKRILSFHDPRDELTRTYICKTVDQRDAIMEDIVMSTMSTASGLGPQQWHVKKVNDAGKQQARLFKMTRDSLLNLKGNEIRREWPFSFIENISNEEEIVWLNVKIESDKRKIICPDTATAVSLVTAVKNGMASCQRTDLESGEGRMEYSDTKDDDDDDDDDDEEEEEEEIICDSEVHLPTMEPS